jgi:hypothetical protein
MATRFCGNREQKPRVPPNTGDSIHSNLLAKELYSPSDRKDSSIPKSNGGRKVIPVAEEAVAHPLPH